jgi:hypothetical protein
MRSLSSRKSPASSLAQQGDLFGAPCGALEGFRYQPDLLTPDEEADLVGRLAELPFKAFSISTAISPIGG